jgi:hypothetical protein
MKKNVFEWGMEKKRIIGGSKMEEEWENVLMKETDKYKYI